MWHASSHPVRSCLPGNVLVPRAHSAAGSAVCHVDDRPGRTQSLQGGLIRRSTGHITPSFQSSITDPRTICKPQLVLARPPGNRELDRKVAQSRMTIFISVIVAVAATLSCVLGETIGCAVLQQTNGIQPLPEIKTGAHCTGRAGGSVSGTFANDTTKSFSLDADAAAYAAVNRATATVDCPHQCGSFGFYTFTGT